MHSKKMDGMGRNINDSNTPLTSFIRSKFSIKN